MTFARFALPPICSSKLSLGSTRRYHIYIYWPLLARGQGQLGSLGKHPAPRHAPNSTGKPRTVPQTCAQLSRHTSNSAYMHPIPHTCKQPFPTHAPNPAYRQTAVPQTCTQFRTHIYKFMNKSQCDPNCRLLYFLVGSVRAGFLRA